MRLGYSQQVEKVATLFLSSILVSGREEVLKPGGYSWEGGSVKAQHRKVGGKRDLGQPKPSAPGGSS